MKAISYFFESLDTPADSSSLWSLPSTTPTGKVVFARSLLKHSKNSQGETTLTERYFILQEEYLMYKTTEESRSISSAMKVKFARLLLPPVNSASPTLEDQEMHPYAIKICYRNKFSLFYAKSESDFKAWIAAMTSVMIRSDIHDRFDITTAIGEGAFAHVYKAKERDQGKLFAVKGFNKAALLEAENGKQILWNEIEIMKKVKGKENVVSLHEVHDTKSSVYLIMDYVEGGNLEDLIGTKHKLSEETIINITRGLLQGINSLMSVDVFHRDLKPANVMLKKTAAIKPEDVVLVDFGLAVRSCDTDPIFRRCGTPGYIAPEVISMKGEESYQVPVKCDIYSIGIILHMLCTGKCLFDKPGYDEDKVLKKNFQSKVDYPQQAFNRLDKRFVGLLQGLLVADPSKRISLEAAIQASIFPGPIEESFESSLGESADSWIAPHNNALIDSESVSKPPNTPCNSSCISSFQPKKNVDLESSIAYSPFIPAIMKELENGHQASAKILEYGYSRNGHQNYGKSTVGNQSTVASPYEVKRHIQGNQVTTLNSYLSFPAGS